MSCLLRIEDFKMEVSIQTGAVMSSHHIYIPKLEVERYTNTIILGQSGSGKSIFMRYLAGLQSNYQISQGSIVYQTKNEDIHIQPGNSSEAMSALGFYYLFQEPSAILDASRTIYDYFVLLQIRVKKIIALNQFVEELSRYDMHNMLDRKVKTLSGGESQRLMMVLMSMMKPNLILGDEPFSSLDYATHGKLASRLNEDVIDQTTSLILATHEMRDINVFGIKQDTQYYIFEPMRNKVKHYQLQHISEPEAVRESCRYYQGTHGTLSDFGSKILNNILLSSKTLGIFDKKISTSAAENKPIEYDNLLLEIKNLHYHRGKKIIFEKLSVALEKGGFTGLLGKTGSGKTTLLELLVRFYKKKQDTFFWHKNINLKEPIFRYHVQYVFQDTDRAMQWEIGNLQSIIQAVIPENKKDENKIFVRDIILLMGLEKVKTMPITHLSGGEKRRVYLARACTILKVQNKQPALLILDEFTVGLDPINQHKILFWLNSFVDNNNIALLVVSHEPAILSFMNCNQWIELS